MSHLPLLLALFSLILGCKAIINVHQVLQKIHEKNLVLVKNMNQICPHPTAQMKADRMAGLASHVRQRRQLGANIPLEETPDLAGLKLLNAQKILETLSLEMSNAIFIGYKTATANVNLGSREGPKVLPLGTTLEELFKTYKIYRTTYTSYIEGWVHRVMHDLPTELKRIERNEVFRFSARDGAGHPDQLDMFKYWGYDQHLDKDIEIFARSVRDRLICMYEAFEDVFYQDVYKPNFVTQRAAKMKNAI